MLYIYTRVSTAEQIAGTSLEDQESKCRAIATLRGCQPNDIAVFSDPGISGTIPFFKRPAGRQLFDLTDKGDVIVASKLDRMFRSTRDAVNVVEDLRACDIGIILADIGTTPITDNGVSKVFFAMLAAFADFERGRINERTEEGRKGKRARGGFMGGHSAPYGFRVVGQGRDSRLEPVEEEQHAIRLAQELARQKLRPMQIIRLLESHGVRARNGKPFMIPQVERILKREVPPCPQIQMG
jgi:DNA invertase Pin-like site-specific DNA recombinase